MTLQQRILNMVDLSSPQQVKKAVGSLYHYHKRAPKSAARDLLRTTEWLYSQVSHHNELEWRSILEYVRGVLTLMRKS